MNTALGTWVAISALLLFCGFVFWVLRRVRRGQVQRRNAPDRLPDMRCPVCGQAMQAGYVLAGNGLIWQPPDARRSFFKQGIWRALPNTTNTGFVARRLHARRCERCQVLMLDYAAQV